MATQTQANADGEDLVVPDGQWDIMAYMLHGNTQMLLFDRPLQGPVKVPVVAGQQQLIISFHAGSYMAKIPRSKQGVHFLLVQNNQTFQLADKTFPIPTFDTLKILSKHLSKAIYLYKTNESHKRLTTKNRTRVLAQCSVSSGI